MSFKADNLTFRYPHVHASAVDDVSLSITPGRMFAIIGPNGSGKSTLLRALLGSITPTSGTVTYAGRTIADWQRAELARRGGAVTQIEEMPFPVSGRELVSMGRYPHLGPLRPEGEADRTAVAAAMQRCDVTDLAARAMDTLSGGERQRARIARALAQTPETLVLDEPTASLDIGHEMAVFELLRSLAHGEGRTVVVATHNLNLAARYADSLLLLHRGRAAASGDARSVMRQEVIESVYAWPVNIFEHHAPGFDRGTPQVAPVSRTSTD
jgi:iron complex transport system ATP-binding protein